MGKVDNLFRRAKWNAQEKRSPKFSDIKNVDIPLLHHVYVCGLSGMGKTTTIQRLLQRKKNIPFLIIEPTQSRQYRNLERVRGEKNVKRQFSVYSIGDDCGEKLELNPFYIPYGMDFTAHIELLKASFSAAITTKEPLVYQYIEQAIPEIYFDRGWDRITHQHKMLKTETDYTWDEHWFYFPRMQDLYDKVIELSESSAFTEGGENKGTIKELVKSNIRIFLSGALGRTFNTYKNDLYEQFETRDIVLEIPNTISSSVPAILNILLGIVIEIIGQRKPSRDGSKESNVMDDKEEPKHITVFEEAQLLFNANDDDKLHNAATRKLEQLLSTSRKFGESIIIANQDPAAIHKSVLGNIRNRLIHKINSSDIAQRMAEDYNLELDEMLHDISQYKYWYSLDSGQYQALKYGEVDEQELRELKNSYCYDDIKPILKTNDFILGYAGLDNINDQLYYAATYIKMLADRPQEQQQIALDFYNHIKQLISQKCECKESILTEYMAYLTCMLFGKYGKVEVGLYDLLIKIYDDLTKKGIPIRIYNISYMAGQGQLQRFLEHKISSNPFVENQNRIKIFYNKWI